MNKNKIIVVLLLAVAISFAQPVFSDDKILTSDDVAALRVKAEAGDAEAQFQLGDAYQKGEGTHQDDTQAARWFQDAANQGNSDAQYALGFAYRGGFGVPKDEVLAYMWFDIAAGKGNEEALDMRSAVAELMTYDQISEARKKARDWKPVMQEKK
jgi:TPR repeat protein